MKREDMDADLRRLVPIEVDRWLSNWAAWSARETYGRGFPDHSAGFGIRGTAASVEDWEESADSVAGQIADTVIWSLAPLHTAAICLTYGVAVVWRFRPRIEDVLPAAAEAFWSKARGKLE